jgi:hypothetical protein
MVSLPTQQKAQNVCVSVFHSMCVKSESLSQFCESQ